jgi:hypothetical protein
MSIDTENLWNGYKYTLKSMPRGIDFKEPITNSCNFPYKDITVDLNANCFLCRCDGWLPIPVGEVKDFNSIEEVFNSPVAKILQKDVTDKKFTFCAVGHCGIMSKNNTSINTCLSINIDESCNLACPSCRIEQFMVTDADELNKKSATLLKIMDWLEKYNDPIEITMSGNGDCLASAIMRPLIKTYKLKPNQYFKLFTNGLLIKKTLADAPIFNNIHNFRISVDAGSAEVYKVVRRPGKWENLLDNLDWLDSQGVSNKISLMFVLQQKNYQDLYNFLNFCVDRGYTGYVTQLDDWCTWSSNINVSAKGNMFSIKNGTFFDNNVLDPSHSEHHECLTILKNIKEMNIKSLTFSSPILKLL